MLYVFTGTDRDKIYRETNAMLAALAKKRPNAEVFRMSDSADILRLPDLIEGTGLFEEKHIVVLQGILDTEEARALASARAKDIAASEHIFIVIEHALTADIKKTLKKHAHAFSEYDVTKEKPKTINVFALTDAIARRDKKQAWVILQRVLREGTPAEEIHGIVWWQIKTLLLVLRGDTADIKPFTISKAKSALPHFSEAELSTYARQLVTMYHDSRAQGPSLDIALEQFVLGL